MNRYPYRDFHIAAPESEGVRPSGIERMVSALAKEKIGLHSLLIWRHGSLVFEQYAAPYTADTPHSMYSCSKTFTSMLIGIAEGKGLLSTEDPVLSIFPEVAVDAPSDNLAAMKVKHLLMMGCGHAGDSFDKLIASSDGDWAHTFLNLPVPHEPGTHFVYNTGATYMLSAILTRVTGKSALELANEWLFSPLGIADAKWDACPRGISLGGTGLRIRPRDMLKLGILILSHGRWQDRQLIPKEYIDRAQNVQISNRNPDAPNLSSHWSSGYGYQMWRCGFEAFRADGMGGQYIVMLPKYDMVVAITSGVHDMDRILDLIGDCILPDICPCAQIPSPSEADSLAESARAYFTPDETPAPDMDLPFGRTLTLPENGSFIRALTVNQNELTLRLSKDTSGLPALPDPDATCVCQDECISLRLGWNAPAVTEGLVHMPHRWMLSSRMTAMARREGDGLYLCIGFLGEPFIWHITLIPEGNAVRVKISPNLAAPFEAVCFPDEA